MAELSTHTKDDELVRIMSVLGDKTRFKIFKLLLKSDELCVSEIAQELGVSTSAVSQHFKLFEMADIVRKKRVGQKMCHEVNTDNQIIRKLKKVM